MKDNEKPMEIVYRHMLPFSEQVSPEVPWAVGDRVVSKLGDGAGVIHRDNDCGNKEVVCVIFDADPQTLAWMCDDELRKEE